MYFFTQGKCKSEDYVYTSGCLSGNRTGEWQAVKSDMVTCLAGSAVWGVWNNCLYSRGPLVYPNRYLFGSNGESEIVLIILVKVDEDQSKYWDILYFSPSAVWPPFYRWWLKTQTPRARSKRLVLRVKCFILRLVSLNSQVLWEGFKLREA